MLSPGHVVGGKYRVLRLIGEGGMGSVYEAQHEVLGNRVALKFLHPEIASQPGLEQRFLQEAKLSATIDDPHIVRVADVDTAPEGAYLVMELLQGEPLQAVMDREGPLGTDRSIRFTLQILDGLNVAHRLGVVHRDLKPDNVFVTPSNSGPLLKLLDFGIAKLRAEEGYQMTLTRPGAIMGTPEYMAPEQAYSADLVDQRSDLYAVGVMLFEMLSGKRPADGDSPQEIAEKTIKKQVLQLGDLCPHLPPSLVSVVHHAIAASPDDRFADAMSMARALHPFTPMTGGPIASTIDRSTAASTPFFTVSKTPKVGEHFTSNPHEEVDRRSAVVPTIPPAAGPPMVATQNPKAKTASMPQVAAPPQVSHLPYGSSPPPKTLSPLPPAPIPTRATSRRRSSAWIWVALLMALAGGSAAGAWYYFEIYLDPGPPPPQPVRRVVAVASSAPIEEEPALVEADDDEPTAEPRPRVGASPRPSPRPADPVPTLPTFQLPTNLPFPTAIPTTLPTSLPTTLPTLFPAPSTPNPPPETAP